MENLEDLKGPVIFACNHQSEIDPFLVPTSLPFFSRFSPLFYATREKKFYSENGWRKHLFGGLFINMWGGYTAFTGLRNYAKALTYHIDIINDGWSFCVFPEGGITRDGNIQSAKGGVTYLAYVSKATIIPVYFGGGFGMSIKDFFLRKRKIKVAFGLPMRMTDRVKISSFHDYKQYANTIMRVVKGLSYQ